MLLEVTLSVELAVADFALPHLGVIVVAMRAHLVRASCSFLASRKFSALVAAVFPCSHAAVHGSLAMLRLGVLNERFGAEKLAIARRAFEHRLPTSLVCERVQRDGEGRGEKGG